MNTTSLKIIGEIDEILEIRKDQSATVLFKVQQEQFNLKDLMIIVEMDQREFKKINRTEKENIMLIGRFELRNGEGGNPIVYLKCQCLFTNYAFKYEINSMK